MHANIILKLFSWLNIWHLALWAFLCIFLQTDFVFNTIFQYTLIHIQLLPTIATVFPTSKIRINSRPFLNGNITLRYVSTYRSFPGQCPFKENTKHWELITVNLNDEAELDKTVSILPTSTSSTTKMPYWSGLDPSCLGKNGVYIRAIIVNWRKYI